MDSLATPLLNLLIVLPLVGALAIVLVGPRQVARARSLALVFVILNLAVTIVALAPAVPVLESRPDNAATFQPLFATVVPVLPMGPAGSGIQYFIGLDGINIWLVALTSFLMLPSVLIGWQTIQERANEYYAWLLVLQAAMTGVFLAFDLVLFYVFFELTLVPLFFLIGIWGGPMRREASRKFFLYTLAGSLITLLGAIAVVLICGQHGGKVGGPGTMSFSIPDLVNTVQGFLASGTAQDFYGPNVQRAIFLALALGFSIKVPLFPLHTWLPLAHVEAPTAGSVLLAGVLLKLGTYGFLRLCLPLTPDAALAVGVPLVCTLAAIGVIYGALCAFAQSDIKKLVAYSSVSHLGVCMLGIFALNATGLAGGLMQMINHGLSTGGLFLLVGMLYDRYHTRMMGDYSGMAARLKVLSAFMVFICLSSVGLPGLNGFIGEMLVLAGVYDMKGTSISGFSLAVVVAIGIILGGWYLMTMLMRVFFGPLKEPGHDGHAIADLNGRELATILPVMALCLLMGVWPQPFLRTTQADINVVARIMHKARDRAAPASVAADTGTPTVRGQ